MPLRAYALLLCTCLAIAAAAPAVADPAALPSDLELQARQAVLAARAERVAAAAQGSAAGPVPKGAPAIGAPRYLKASNSQTLDNFGIAVAVSGNTIVVGAQGEDSNANGSNGDQSDNSAENAGAVYVFVAGANGWTQQAYLKASNSEATDFFGGAVAISGDTLVVGANGEDSGARSINGNQGDNSAASAGAAYVFVRSGTQWAQQAYLKASNADAGDRFGFSVSVSGDTVVVGAFGEDSSATTVNGSQTSNAAENAGAAYVFVRNGTQWSQQAYLKPNNTGAGDGFGEAVAVSGDRVVVGAPREDSGADGIDGPGSDNSASEAGAAYVFARSGTAWTQQAYLKAGSSSALDGFGHAVAIAGASVVVGAPFEDGSGADSGAAHAFFRDDIAWRAQGRLAAASPAAGDLLGWRVGIDGDLAVAGARGADQGGARPDSGEAQAFRRANGTWSTLGALRAGNADDGDAFGSAIGVAGTRIVVGAPGEDSGANGPGGNGGDDSAPNAGAAYAFEAIATSFAVGLDGDEPDAAAGDGACDIDLGSPGAQCTLRAAITEANALPGAQAVRFDIRDPAGIPVAGVPALLPTTPLPPITGPLLLDGSTQSAGRVAIDGALVGGDAPGLDLLEAEAVTLRGLAVLRFPGAGVRIRGGGGHVLQGNWIGYAADGETPVANAGGALRIEPGAATATTDITLGAGIGDDAGAENRLFGAVAVLGGDTRGVRLLRNRLELPPSAAQGNGLRLPFDLGDDGPSCHPWIDVDQPAPNGGMPAPRILRLPEGGSGAIEGITRPGATVVASRATAIGSGRGRYWPRRLEPLAIGLADGNGGFALQPASPLSAGDRIVLHAVDAAGNASESSQLRRPVIFAPGIGGTWLRSALDEDLWLPLVDTSFLKNFRMRRLAMEADGETSVETIRADEVLESIGPARVVYGPLHDRLQAAGFNGHPRNLDPATLDQWRFPNDWRRSATVLADDLRALVDRVTRDTASPGGAARSCEADLVAHSNGGVIAAVYLRRDAAHARDHVHRFITSGTPYLGAPQAIAGHASGYVFDAERQLQFFGGWVVEWGRMTEMLRNVPGAYGLLPSRNYFLAADGSSLSHSAAVLVDLDNAPLSTFNELRSWMVAPKASGAPIANGLQRNAQLWYQQQDQVHDLIDDWRDYDGPPQVFRHVGRIAGATATGWFLGPGPATLGPSDTLRSEDDDTDRHRAWRERLTPVFGLGDGTVPLVSASLGRDPRVGRLDLSGVGLTPWIAETETYACRHGELVEPGCPRADGPGADALERLLAILESGHAVPQRPAASRTPTGPAAAGAEVFYVKANVPVRVVLTAANGTRTGALDPAEPQQITYGIPGVTYVGSRFGAAVSIPTGVDVDIEVIALASGARVSLIRQQVGTNGVLQVLFPDLPLAAGGAGGFALDASSTPSSTPWTVDANGDGTPEPPLPPAAILPGATAVPAIPVAQPSSFDLLLRQDRPVRTLALRLPDTGTSGWTWTLAGSAPWLTVSATSGASPAEIQLTFDASALPLGEQDVQLELVLRNGSYASTQLIPIRLRVGPALPEVVLRDGFEP